MQHFFAARTSLVYDVRLRERESLALAFQPYLHESEFGKNFQDNAGDDERAVVNEFCELGNRASGFMATGQAGR